MMNGMISKDALAAQIEKGLREAAVGKEVRWGVVWCGFV